MLVFIAIVQSDIFHYVYVYFYSQNERLAALVLLNQTNFMYQSSFAHFAFECSTLFDKV